MSPPPPPSKKHFKTGNAKLLHQNDLSYQIETHVVIVDTTFSYKPLNVDISSAVTRNHVQCHSGLSLYVTHIMIEFVII